MKIIECAQYSPEWYNARMGKPTASMFHKIVTPTGQLSRQAGPYMYKLLAERLLMESMQDQLGFVEWAERGKLEQRHAAAQFEFTHDIKLREVGFVTTDDGQIGCSPDYLYANRCVEVKCPAPWTQLMYLSEGPGADYTPQVQGQLMIGEWDSAHFYSYHPRMPPYDAMLGRDAGYIGKLAHALGRFLDDMNVAHERLKQLGAYVRLDGNVQGRLPLERAYPEALPEPLQIEVPE
jgi:hypothetical protein